ncbi:MAG: antibiotic biosynthesis monooxygenase family protein [Desulfofustis sp.]|jgi:quinol monooxygenase YgiN|nr:antibiotic biosynthesis monooxygenase family protein [Desulfofustis sp.]
MNTITFFLEISAAKQKEFMQTVRLLNERIKNEKGLVKLNLFQSVDNPSLMQIIEEWRTQEDLDTHTRSENFRLLVSTLKVLSKHSRILYELKPDRAKKMQRIKL